jgi:hypothetical protein
MNLLHQFKPLVARRRALGRLIVALLPLVLAACTNGSGGGPGY